MSGLGNSNDEFNEPESKHTKKIKKERAALARRIARLRQMESAQGVEDEDKSDKQQDDGSMDLSNQSSDAEGSDDDEAEAPVKKSIKSNNTNDNDSNDQVNKMRIMNTKDHIVDFKDLLPEIEKMDFKIIQVSSKGLGHILSKFVALGSLVHKITPEDLTIVANLDGDYPNKETARVHTHGLYEVPNTLFGLLANGTKFFDAAVYLGMDPDRRPKPVQTEFEKLSDGTIEVPTYDDMAKLTTYIFVVFFYIIIRAHAPSDSDAYQNQPIPKFITTVMGCKASISEICSYVSSFDLIKLSPEWVKYVPTKNISQESMNRLGLGVAGYRITSVFNIVEPDLYLDESDLKNEYRKKAKPTYLDTAVLVMKSFKLAGFCWDFHPATRSPDIISKYGNINKNANNLLLESFKTATLVKLVSLRKLAVMPTYDPSHTDYKTWTKDMVYKATNKIFKK